MEGVGEFGGRMLRRSFQPLDAFLRSLGQSQFSVQFRNAQAVLCTWVESTSILKNCTAFTVSLLQPQPFSQHVPARYTASG